MPKLTTEVWKYYTLIASEKKVECIKCGKKLKECGNTTNY